MPDRYILTPYFLDQPRNELLSLTRSGWHINRPALPEGDDRRRMPALHQSLADFVAGAITNGDRPISIAGDCCTAIGVLAGLQRAGVQPALIWLDAHGDFNTWETTPSGFLGGMPLAMMAGRGEQTLVQAAGLQPIPEEQVILTDGRDLDPGEKQALAGSQVHHLADSQDLLGHPLLAHPVYIHFDTDILNPQEAPAMSYPAPGGPSATELQALFRELASTARIVAISMTTWNPQLDQAGRTQAVCMDLLQVLIE